LKNENEEKTARRARFDRTSRMPVLIHIVPGVCLVIIRLTPQWVWQLHRGKPGLGNYALVKMERRQMLVLIASVSNKSGTVEQIVPFFTRSLYSAEAAANTPAECSRSMSLRH
jgi:hypothetical protein